MFRNILTLSVLSLTTGCSTLDPLTESPFPSTEENYGEEALDTGDTASDEESCSFTAQWVVEADTVSLDSVTLPRLEVGTSCTSPAAINSIDIYFSSDRWLEQISDTRLGVGTEYEHLGVYSATELMCQQDRCGALWEIDQGSHSSAYPTIDYTVSFGFSLAAFADDENMAKIDELWDDVGDEVILTAVINDGEETRVVAQATITITAPVE